MHIYRLKRYIEEWIECLLELKKQQAEIYLFMLVAWDVGGVTVVSTIYTNAIFRPNSEHMHFFLISFK